ncbi:hypothetical protein AZH53_08310 [Methanomicrobiaceae archaeon CYW5]|uniref:HAD family hydrolase n=1 Tax=Methanovulcanius yangii TaxID=1789227 RepID=UPI0029CA3E3A|nr:hypothetical protein [Methanovulcanius yangii]MBT8508405.1 hypothetical protein [Methanovulcanius yangii]
MPTWMTRLARHYRAAMLRFPDSRQLILFDIDGTIVDSRESVRTLLQAYDREHATAYFADLTADAVTVTEDHLVALLAARGVPEVLHTPIQEWCSARRWSKEAALASHRPYTGVLEVIRWFQLQPRTFVGLNTARDETLRETTLRSLNAIGREYKVRFSSDLLHMNPGGWEEIQRSKAAAIDFFTGQGYHVFAMIDNEPENLRAVALEHPEETLLLLHADTIFRTRRTRLPPEAVSGTGYRLADIVRTRGDLPRHITFVWHGVNNPRTLRQFLASGITWAEVDIRTGPDSECVCGREREGEASLSFAAALAAVGNAGRSLRIELREGGRLPARCIDALNEKGWKEEKLWFHCDPELTGPGAVGALRDAFPAALMQVPGDAVALALQEGEEHACGAVAAARALGAERLSFRFTTPNLADTLDFLDRCGMTADIRRETELDDFLRSVLLMPASVASDFRFPPGWDFAGRTE